MSDPRSLPACLGQWDGHTGTAERLVRHKPPRGVRWLCPGRPAPLGAGKEEHALPRHGTPAPHTEGLALGGPQGRWQLSPSLGGGTGESLTVRENSGRWRQRQNHRREAGSEQRRGAEGEPDQRAELSVGGGAPQAPPLPTQHSSESVTIPASVHQEGSNAVNPSAEKRPG